MPLIADEYNPEKYDRYDIAGMNEEELLSSCRMIARENEFDEATKEVLCWGLLKVVEEDEPLEMEIETVASDGTLLKGILHGQKIGDTVISSPADLFRKWYGLKFFDTLIGELI